MKQRTHPSTDAVVDEMTQPHRRLEELGWYVLNVLSPMVARALHNLHREQALCDGFPSRGESAGRGTGDTSTTEAAAAAGASYARMIEDINDAVWGLEIALNYLNDLTNQALSRVTSEMPVLTRRCADGQVGKDAGLWSSDLKCQELPTKAGCCQRHYTQWYRFRQSRGIDTSNDYEPAP